MASTDRFRNLVEASIQGILVQRDFEVLFANQRAAEIAGYDSVERLTAVGLLDVVPEEDRQANRDSYAALMAGEAVPNPTEARLLRPDGSVVWIERVISRVDWDGTPAMMGTAIEITERKRAEQEREAAHAEIVRLKEALRRERDYLRAEVHASLDGGAILGAGPAHDQLLERIGAVAATDATVLVTGESGVGKELVAHEIHARSRRADGPLVKVNCASVPRELFESEFFGHVKGAFTGALKDRMGRFALADGGTLFLDEVGEIPLELQGKLLRVLQERELQRVGDESTRRVDVRIVAATNRDLHGLVKAGSFREDLYYRLGVFPIEVPPLRRRRETISLLASRFVAEACAAFGRPRVELAPEQLAILKGHDWPGNIRELRNVIERAVILSDGDTLSLESAMPAPAGRLLDPPNDGRRFVTVADFKRMERENLERALVHAGWRVAGAGGAAELLGISPSTLRDRIKSLGIQRASHTASRR